MDGYNVLLNGCVLTICLQSNGQILLSWFTRPFFCHHVIKFCQKKKHWSQVQSPHSKLLYFCNSCWNQEGDGGREPKGRNVNIILEIEYTFLCDHGPLQLVSLWVHNKVNGSMIFTCIFVICMQCAPLS